jgi:hypothetical protein
VVVVAVGSTAGPHLDAPPPHTPEPKKSVGTVKPTSKCTGTATMEASPWCTFSGAPCDVSWVQSFAPCDTTSTFTQVDKRFSPV